MALTASTCVIALPGSEGFPVGIEWNDQISLTCPPTHMQYWSIDHPPT